MTRRKRIWITVAASSAFIVVTLIVAAGRIPFSSDTLRKRVISTLADRFDAEVELDNLTLRLYPQLHVVGLNLIIRRHGRPEPPLISVRRLTVNGSLLGLWKRRVDHVTLDGLTIQIPPDDSKPDGAPSGLRKDGPLDAEYARQVVIAELEAPEAKLVILRRDPQKPPRIWSLHSLRVQSVGMLSAMPFEAVLTNAIPPGEIVTAGTFGPWQREEPGQTALAGQFTFDKADLSVFEGISGILSAHGSFNGTLDRIAVDGQTKTPDFMIAISGHPVPLTTNYHAVVDGTSGNTTLDPIDATFLNTSLVATGGVYDEKDRKGRVIQLDVEIEEGRMEDIMTLAVNTPQPSMAGGLYLKTRFVIPPGKGDVVNKLQLTGQFAIRSGRFTDRTVQEKVNNLSRRARGQPVSVEQAVGVTSNFKGQFVLRNGRLRLPNVAFDVPGAVVELGGEYALRQQTIAFEGNLFMDAKISQTMSGFKSWLLKIADPLFRRNGRTVVPLRIDGTRRDPHFGLDVRRVFRRAAK